MIHGNPAIILSTIRYIKCTKIYQRDLSKPAAFGHNFPKVLEKMTGKEYGFHTGKCGRYKSQSPISLVASKRLSVNVNNKISRDINVTALFRIKLYSRSPHYFD